jgi:phenylpropionate dioxygenase-like ring-hydroxylating dioxygenase large terminal subunit
MQRIPLPPYPNGWWAVSHSDELAVGDVKTVQVLGRELVVFRGAGGHAHAVDPYCAHLGAHLGVGGRVVGDAIRCPFHGWCYDGTTGRCTLIPYTDKLPPKAAVGSWPVWENNGFVFVWYHADGKPADWTPDVVEELEDPGYYLWGKKEWRISSHPQEIMENGVDIQHFFTLHGWKAKSIDWQPAGHRYTLRIDVDSGAEEQAATAANATDVDSFNSGPSFTCTRVRGPMTGIAINVLIPVAPEQLLIQHRYYGHKQTDPSIVEAFFTNYIRDYELDIPIWNAKIYRPIPVIAENDGPYVRYRRWYAQFYSKTPQEAVAAGSGAQSSAA